MTLTPARLERIAETSNQYIVLEGTEGSGKTTVSALITATLHEAGHAVTAVREPGGTALGEQLRNILLHGDNIDPWTEVALFAAARAQLYAEVIRPALDRGDWVISDRSYYSSLAYQGGARGLGIDLVRQINELVIGSPLPDHVIVLDIDPADGYARETGRDRISAEGLDFQLAVQAAFRHLAATDRAVEAVSAAGTPDEVASDVIDAILRRTYRRVLTS